MLAISHWSALSSVAFASMLVSAAALLVSLNAASLNKHTAYDRKRPQLDIGDPTISPKGNVVFTLTNSGTGDLLNILLALESTINLPVVMRPSLPYDYSIEPKAFHAKQRWIAF